MGRLEAIRFSFARPRGEASVCFVAEALPEQAFRLALAPWPRKDRETLGDVELPGEGIGCRHPVTELANRAKL